MATFFLQDQELVDDLGVELLMLEDQLSRMSFIHSYQRVSSFEEVLGDDSSKTVDFSGENTIIPVGTIDFVTKYLNKYKGIEKENPIEIPKYLRTDEFLKRDYAFVGKDSLPTSGNFFIKDVSELKRFSGLVNFSYTPLESFFTDERGVGIFDPSHRFLVSEPYEIQSEWRVYVISGYIETICHYNGDCRVYPDMNIINKAVNLITMHEKWLKSYTIDVMVGKRGTALIEVHNFASVGLYSTLWSENLPWAYRDGIDYLLKDNRELEL